MAEITHGVTERYRIFYPTCVQERELTMCSAREFLIRGFVLDMFVKGWSEPWSCRLDGRGDIRAKCPSSSAEPVVVDEDLRKLQPRASAEP
jgi:hypothetical protein